METTALLVSTRASFLGLGSAATAQDEPGGTPEAGKVDKGDATEGEGGATEGEGDAEDPAEAKKRKKAERAAAKLLRKNGGRDLDPESPEAEALEELLLIDTKYAKDGTVQIMYTFREPTHIQDWDQAGFDKADQTAGRGFRRKRRAERRGAPTRFLSLAVGSNGKGILMHELEMKGEYEVTWTVMVNRMTNRSDLVFFAGKAGVRFGNQFVKGSKASFRPAVRGVKPDTEPFADRRRTIVRMVLGSGKIKAYVNGAKVGETEKLKGKLDGRIGLFARDMNLTVQQVEIKGEINKKKL